MTIQSAQVECSGMVKPIEKSHKTALSYPILSHETVLALEISEIYLCHTFSFIFILTKPKAIMVELRYLLMPAKLIWLQFIDNIVCKQSPYTF